MTLPDLLVVAAAMIGVGLAAVTGCWVVAQEGRHRCLWCSGSGRQWGDEHGTR